MQLTVYFRQRIRVKDEHCMAESDITLEGKINNSLDRCNTLEEKEKVNTGTEKKNANNVKMSPLFVTSYSHPPDGEFGKHSASGMAERRVRRDIVKIMVKEGKVVFINHDVKRREVDAE